MTISDDEKQEGLPSSVICHLRLRRYDQAAVLEFDLRRLVRAAFRTAVQRIDGHRDLVPGPQALGGQALAHLQARRAALQNPFLLDAVLAFDRHDQDGVGADEPELLHGPGDFLRVQGIEHGKRMMRRRGRAHCQEGRPDQQSRKLRFHASSPLPPQVFFGGGAGMPAILMLTEPKWLRLVKNNVFKSSPPKPMFVVAGWPWTMRPSFFPCGSRI